MKKDRYGVYKLLHYTDGDFISLGPPRGCSLRYEIGKEVQTEDGSPIFALDDERYARRCLREYLKYHNEMYPSRKNTIKLFRATTTEFFPEKVHWVPIYYEGVEIRRFWAEQQYRERSGHASLHLQHTVFCNNLTIIEELTPLPERKK